MSSVDVLYQYQSPSRVTAAGDCRTLSLVSERAQPGGQFLQARCLAPQITARSLRAVSEIVGSRFYVPPSMLARILREADPVATVSRKSVRFEGFSACCSTYIRLDIDEEALETRTRRKGTTNVDFGPELRAALATVARDSHLELSIGPEAVGISHERGEAVERKVPLPERWIKGFREVQSHLAGMKQACSLPPAGAQRFLRSLPRGKSDHVQWVASANGAATVTARESPGAVPLRGGHRLRVFEALAPLATSLEVWWNAELGSSAWVLEFQGQRLSIVLNAEPWRGFSGDGAMLHLLAAGDIDIAPIRAQLDWQDHIDVPSLARVTGLDIGQTRNALALLSGMGQLGYDLQSASYFHRVLPFEADTVDRLNPRLKAARTLVTAGAVTCDPESTDAQVRSGSATHIVRPTADGLSCTCPWYARHGSTRGPCKHQLAVAMIRKEAE